MKAGKIPEAVLKRTVINPVNQYGKKQNVSAGVGKDAGLFAIPETDVLAQSGTVLSGNVPGMAELAVFRACNSLLAAGTVPTGVSVQLMLPETMEEDALKETMQELLKACETTGTALVNGHTQISPLVSERVIAVTATGAAPKTALLNETVAGSELVMTKTAGLAGTVLLSREYREKLHERYTYDFIGKAEARGAELFAPEAKLLSELGIVHMHDVAEGGVFGAVWEFAERLKSGVELELKQIPILQETVEICEFFDINPYQCRGDGAMLFLTGDSAGVIEELKKAGVFAAVIGRMTAGNDRIIINEDEVRHLEPNRVEEYERAKQIAKGWER